jgi:hypothetical protein
LRGVKDVKTLIEPAAGLASDMTLGTARSLIRAVGQGIASTPLLVCRKCRYFAMPCPECDAYVSDRKRPASGEIVNCPKCQLGFTTCERSDRFDRLLKKREDPWYVVVGLILLAVVAILLRKFFS